jgi:hypothetical protein
MAMDAPFAKGIHGEKVIHALPALRRASEKMR